MRVARKPKLCGSCNSEHRGYISDTLHFVRLRLQALKAEEKVLRLQVLKAEEKVILLEIDKEGER